VFVMVMGLTGVALAGPTEEAREPIHRGTAGYNLGMLPAYSPPATQYQVRLRAD
jgi:hypothetical protein